MVILITGATGKLGKQFTYHFLSQGHTIIAISRSSENLTNLVKETFNFPGKLKCIKNNLITDGTNHIIKCLQNDNLLPDVIINNAVDLSNQQLPDNGLPTYEQWQIEFELAIIIPFNLIMEIATIQKAKLFTVINIASMYGVVARNPNLYNDPLHESPIHYGVAKAAMIHLTKELAIRLAPIRVNAISFGGVEGRVDTEFLKRYNKLCPSNRMLNENEIISPVEFLINASGITGHNLIVDGGWTLW